jgi:hypothetical protein
MKQTILAFAILFSFTASAQTSKKEVPKVDSAQITMETKFISLNDLFRKADMYKDSVMARQYESFMVLFNAIVTQLINDVKKKQ